jgi:hypothetical protein
MLKPCNDFELLTVDHRSAQDRGTLTVSIAQPPSTNDICCSTYVVLTSFYQNISLNHKNQESVVFVDNTVAQKIDRIVRIFLLLRIISRSP